MVDDDLTLTIDDNTYPYRLGSDKDPVTGETYYYLEYKKDAADGGSFTTTLSLCMDENGLNFITLWDFYYVLLESNYESVDSQKATIEGNKYTFNTPYYNYYNNDGFALTRSNTTMAFIKDDLK